MSKTKKHLQGYSRGALLSIIIVAPFSATTFSSTDIPAATSPLTKPALNPISPTSPKPVNAPHTPSVLLTTRGGAVFNELELDTPSNPTAPWVKYVEPVDTVTTSSEPLNSINKAGNNLFSVDEYDSMLRRIVEKTTNNNASLDIWEDIRSGFRLKGYDQIRVDKELNWLKKQQKFLDRVAIRATPFIYFVLNEVKQRDMPTEIALLPIVESAYQPFAYSSSRAAGLWQFIAETGQHYGLELNWWYDGRRDIYRSTLAALDFLVDLHNQFDGDWLLALAAYNSGPGTVDRAIRQNLKKGKKIDFWSLDLPKETRDYVPKLLAVSAVIADPKAYDVALRPIANEPYFKRVYIKKQIDLTLAAKLAEISVNELYAINPSFNRWATAPEGPHHLLIPVNNLQVFEQNLAQLNGDNWVKWKKHETQPSETLISIAQHYKTSTKLLQKVNNLKSDQIISHTNLIVPILNQPENKMAAKNNTQDNKIRHVVQADESLWEVARIYGVKQTDLAKWNKLKHDQLLQPGQKLVVLKNQGLRNKQGKTVRSKTVVASTVVSNTVDSNNKPASSNKPEEPAKSSVQRVNYEVRQGDSLALISNRFNVTVNELRRWNGIEEEQLLPGLNIRLYLHTSDTLSYNNI